MSPIIHPVILSGGVGARLWPLSRSLQPKQFLALASARTMIQETALRVSANGFARPIIICNQDHRFLVAEQMRIIDLDPTAIVLEPFGRNTAPAAAIAALMLREQDPDAIMLLLPADHVIADTHAFHAGVAIAAKAASGGALVTFGITPDAPETGYGYIRRGVPLHDVDGCYAAEEFVEKPQRKTAQSYVNAGNYFWNSGVFLFRAQTYLDELGRLEPAILSACEAAHRCRYTDMGFIRLAKKEFAASPARSIDYAVMEHTARAAIVPVDMGWSDIGSWHSLWQASDHDQNGNIIMGNVTALDSQNSYLRSEGPLLAALGVEDIVVVVTKDAVLVSRRDQTQDVKKIVDSFEARDLNQHRQNPRVLRPWGSYETVDRGENFQIKRIIVNPGARLSLQKHEKRAEHWVVVSGVAHVTCERKTFALKENESTFIPLGAWHRLENSGTEPLNLIEVQSGAYLGEDDIVRRQDDYGR